MLRTRRIYETLVFIDREYNKNLTHSDLNRPIMYSKLGILELCGWVEEGFDEIAINCVRSNLRTRDARHRLEKKIRRTYGLQFEYIFIELLGFALGAVKLHRVETRFARNGNLSMLKDQLNQLNEQRNKAAHTYTNNSIRETTATFDAPSLTIARFNTIKPLLEELWTIVRQLN